MASTVMSRARCKDGCGRAVLELLHQAGVLVAQGAVAHLTDDIETVVRVGASSRSFEHVLVERACHALVRRQHQIGAAGAAVLPLPLVEDTGAPAPRADAGQTREMVSLMRVK